jgi:hypothetical protein
MLELWEDPNTDGRFTSRGGLKVTRHQFLGASGILGFKLRRNDRQQIKPIKIFHVE